MIHEVISNKHNTEYNIVTYKPKIQNTKYLKTKCWIRQA